MTDFFISAFAGIASTFLENPLAQWLWFAAMFVGFFGYATTDDKKTIQIFIGANAVWMLHFLFMANFWALGATIIGFTRLVLSLKYKKNVKVLIGVIVASMIFGAFTFDGQFISILPLIATAVSTYWFFFLEKLQLRIFLLFISGMWFTYHLGTGSISGVLNEVIVVILIGISVFKFTFGTERAPYLRERIRNVLRKRPTRPDFDRFMFLRDKDRFE